MNIRGLKIAPNFNAGHQLVFLSRVVLLLYISWLMIFGLMKRLEYVEVRVSIHIPAGSPPAPIADVEKVHCAASNICMCVCSLQSVIGRSFSQGK